MTYSNFLRDLSVARKTERYIAQKLEERYNLVLDGEINQDSRYDIAVKNKQGKTIFIEIKEDFTCQRTGNVVLEFFCRGKPSGIETTQSHLYIYKLHEPTGVTSYWAVQTKKLKEAIENKQYFRIVNGGDNKTAKNYLFKLHVFKSLGSQLNI